MVECYGSGRKLGWFLGVRLEIFREKEILGREREVVLNIAVLSWRVRLWLEIKKKIRVEFYIYLSRVFKCGFFLRSKRYWEVLK